MPIQLAGYMADFKEERQDREKAHDQTADLEKKVAQLTEELEQERNQLAEHQQSMSAIELVNEKLHQEVHTARGECQRLQEETQAKSSQVKQYAKEVDRLKKQVDT